jgi:hypothetical protein
MTILNILKHHGYNVERGVLPTGRIVFPTAPASSSAAFATAMSVKPHAFHGGGNPVEQVPDSSRTWWTDEAVLERDRQAMARYFPGFVEVADTQNLPPAWVGTLDTGYGVFTVRIQHRADHGLPHVTPAKPKARRRGRRTLASPHTFINGNLCVAAQEDWDPEKDTTATVVGWAAHWHAAYVEWLFTDKWPMEGYEHRAAA